MSEPFIGEIRMFGFGYPPPGWAQCDGQLLSIAQNTALFSLPGTTYGGDGTTNFALPDMRSRVPVGQGQGPGLSSYAEGQQGGAETVTLTAAQMPRTPTRSRPAAAPPAQTSPRAARWPGPPATSTPLNPTPAPS